MSPTRSRRDVLRLAGIAVAFGTGGCLGTSSTDDSAGDSDALNTTTSTTHSPSATSELTTVSPSVLSNEEARERALTAEETHITEAFENASCVEGWGLTSYVGQEKDATVTDRTAEGVVVEVTHPFWYSTEQVEADARSNARYLVTAEGTRRLDGDDVSPC
ncbi:hypothetical protein [Halopelagius longus]|uniref:Uncharacterized protein n=1 Tax=Halopelagius longus TaxID=1236180 RepID=A0A1H0Z038_9EURY|nr:hypothetical protein [Halopelagius longus]RDI72762.1 hypothetical protein DWB78_14085 [Halopelagius longus]SDQ20789.1 hypothetical protein SAMN05216278_0938 [Halopelagius longus]